MGILLYIIATILWVVITPINWVIVSFKHGLSNDYFKSSAINIDKFGNREFRTSLNKTLIHENSPFKFGNIDETISSVLGKNQRYGHLTKFGKVICKILDTIDKNHCEKSIVW